MVDPERIKQVVDEVSGWLRVFDDGSVDRTWTGPAEALFLMEPVPSHDYPRDGIALLDLPGEPSLRLYLPELPPEHAGDGRRKALPILLQFHGGGFCISHFSWLMYHQFYSRLARAVPAIVVSVDLPLAPEHRLPAAMDAGFRALLRLRSLARAPPRPPEAVADPAERLRSGADFSRVFLIGDSSGGNIVHEVAARAGRLEVEQEGFWSPLKVAGGIPLHPGFVRSSRSRSELEVQSDSVFFTLDMLDKFLALALPEGATKDHPYTCPMGEAAPQLEEVRLPPFLVAVAEKDLIRDTNLEYCEAMRRAGKDVEVLVNKGASHSFYLNKVAVDLDPTTGNRTEELILAIKDFMDRH
ncbi:putative carboxylesterase 17 [Cocos nucifera]|uniref:Putative carboxylesterase 17 n=1 Tax=Cocos nucifera TaxID=13894 RepID=A0A8K0HW22_COCNU|nr:putative carboxylesterase 17 [Cocos nucifera]